MENTDIALQSKKAKKISSIAIPLHNFEYTHHTHSDSKYGKKLGIIGQIMHFFSNSEETPPRFFGREQEKNKLLSILKSDEAIGAYLISGYRGCGKTSFINHVITKCDNNVLAVYLPLGNDTALDAEPIFKRMAAELLCKLESKYVIRALIANNLSLIGLVSCIIFMIGAFYFCPQTLSKLLLVDYSKQTIIKVGLLLAGGLIIGYALLKALILLLIAYIPCKISTIIELRNLLNNIKNHMENQFGFASAISLKKTTIQYKMQAADIESSLVNIIKKSRKSKIRIIYIFDELDKISGDMNPEDSQHNKESASRNRIKKIDSLLEKLKNIITESPASFIFVGGREMHDEFLAKAGNASSLYRSVFNHSLYIPSLYSDGSDRQPQRIHSMFESYIVNNLASFPSDKKTNNSNVEYHKLYEYAELLTAKPCEDDYANNCMFVLRNLVHYLVFHTLGNFKQLISSFESFIVSADEYKNLKNKISLNPPSHMMTPNDTGKAEYYLVFFSRDIQRLLLASNIYINHHLKMSRRLRDADDKVVISTFTMLQFILKFHNKGMSRRNLYSMYENICTSRPTELRSITEDLLKSVLPPVLRQSRYGMEKYRFSSLFENEIRYVTEASSEESAVFNFSLDSLESIKQYYLASLSRHINNVQANNIGDIGLIQIYINLGNVYLWEQSYDEATEYFSLARDESKKKTHYRPSSKNLYLYVESSLKLGQVAEKRGNYSVAANIYWQSNEIIWESMRAYKKNDIYQIILKDKKYYYCFQPYWAWIYLGIKEGAPGNPKQDIDKIEAAAVGAELMNTLPVHHYKKAHYYFFINEYHQAIQHYMKAVQATSSSVNEDELYIKYRSVAAIAINRALQFESIMRSNINPCPSVKNTIDETISNTLQIFTEAHDAIKDQLGPSNNKPVIRNRFGKGNNVIVETICDLELAAEGFSCIGLHSFSVSCYTTLFMIIGMFLDAIPRRMVTSEHIEMHNMSWLKAYALSRLELSHKMTSRINQSAHTSFTNNFYAVDLEPFTNVGGKNIRDKNYMKAPHVVLKELLKGRDSETKQAPNNRVYWQRSLQGQLMTELALWLIRKSDITRKNKHSNSGPIISIPDIDINSFPQFGIRSYAIALSLTGRNTYKQLNFLLESKLKADTEEQKLIHADYVDSVFIEASDCIEQSYVASMLIRQSSGNDAEVTFPLQSHTYYQIWEALYDLAWNFELLFCKRQLMELSNKADDLKSVMLVQMLTEALVGNDMGCLYQRKYASCISTIQTYADHATKGVKAVIESYTLQRIVDRPHECRHLCHDLSCSKPGVLPKCKEIGNCLNIRYSTIVGWLNSLLKDINNNWGGVIYFFFSTYCT